MTAVFTLPCNKLYCKSSHIMYCAKNIHDRLHGDYVVFFVVVASSQIDSWIDRAARPRCWLYQTYTDVG